MYTIPEVLTNLDTQLTAILIAGIVMFCGAFLYYGEAVRIGFKHKTHAIPLFANLYFFTHDMAYILLFRRWFFEVDHWFFKLMWVGLAAFNVLELIVLYQTIKFSRQELFPMLTQRQYVAVLGALQVSVAILFWWLYTNITDPLFLLHFAITVVVASITGLPLYLRRRNGQGQSTVLIVGIIIMALGFFFGYLPTMASHFNQPANYAVGALIILINLVHLWALNRFASNKQFAANKQTAATVATSSSPLIP